MQSRVDFFSIPGGDTVQALKTKEYLEKLGLHIDISLELKPDLSAYDLIHIFNLNRIHETFIQARNAVKQKKEFVLTPIYWNYHELNVLARNDLLGRLYGVFHSDELLERTKCVKRFVQFKNMRKACLVQFTIGYNRQRRFLLKNTGMIMPNSISEREQLKKDFDIEDKERFSIVYNAVDRKFDRKREKHNGIRLKGKTIKDFVLCVARFDNRKNQLNLIRAINSLKHIPLVLVGTSTPTHKKYYLTCKKEAGEDIYFIDRIKHEDLPSIYSAAKVHCLPSWLETPGLVSLEAGLAGCNIVVTDRGATREYFEDSAWYCKPGSINSIRQAILKAYNTPLTGRLREHIRKNFLWEKTATDTLKAYQKVLST